jgi:membrane protease YdiL (CAAX protease family)
MLVVLLGNGLFAPLSALLALAWARLSNTPWKDLGFIRPASWMRTVVLGIAIGVVAKLLMKAIVMPLLGAEPINQQYADIAGNLRAVPAMIVFIVLGSGFGEETVYRGFLFERLGTLFGSTRGAALLVLLLTSTWFAPVHFSSQGVAGVQQAFLLGILLGSLYLATRQLWLPMMVHAAFNLTALGLIFWQLEARVATIIFS